MRTHEATPQRLALAFLIGLVVWVVYKALWQVPTFLELPSPVVATDLERAAAFWGFVALASAGEFVAIAVISSVAWRTLRGGGPIRAALLVATVRYLVDALVILLVLPELLSEPPTWRSIVPGLRAISHLSFAAVVGAVVWRVAYRRISESGGMRSPDKP